jgi:hypothetical protein
VLLRQFARQVDKALRPVVTGSRIPLVLAAAEPLASTYRSVNSYSHLATKGRNPSGGGACGNAALACLIQGVYSGSTGCQQSGITRSGARELRVWEGANASSRLA